MRGHVHKREHVKKNGEKSTLYYAVVEMPRVGGKRRSDWGAGFQRKKDAEHALVDKLQRLRTGSLIRPADLTVRECLVRWLESQDGAVKASTLASYRHSVSNYLVPNVGDLSLGGLGTPEIEALSKQLLANGGLRSGKGSKPLSSKTVRNHLGVLGTALRFAERRQWIASNPMSGVTKPSAKRKKQMSVWNAEEVSDFLRGVESHQMATLFHLALYTGARRGELLGLRWEDLDLGRLRMAVRQTLLTGGGGLYFDTPKSHEARTVDLDPHTVTRLAGWRVQQEQAPARATPPTLVFTRPDGSPMHPDWVSKSFGKAVERSECRRITFHEMRHTHASLLLLSGVPVHVVSQRLGHADVGFTLKVYSHVLPGMQADAASAFASLIDGAAPGGRKVKAVAS